MNIINYQYKKRGHLEFVFDQFPNSPVLLGMITNFYFVKHVKWSSLDPIVTRNDLEEMEKLVNREMGTTIGYLMRKSKS
ncbi:hypothetical protein [Peribacillus acanthi]|uniref:hypothetical protein n=1 Tax=Peribacillus acanthi TaxID=2171554 RepID=UPI000D3EAC64|nr:hypothetical protein [Peribacillus acanthi]